MTTQLIVYSGLVLTVTALMLLVYEFARGPVASRPELGPRGAVRRRVLDKGGLFATVEPALRFLAPRLKVLPLSGVRARLTQRIAGAGDWLGLTADEFIALAVMSSLFGAFLGATLVWAASLGSYVILFGALLGGYLPLVELDGARSRRHLLVNRGLPTAIDLASMCVGAGLDFPSSLRQVVQNTANPNDPLRRELERILQELALGRSRRLALEGFAERVPTEAVKDFTGSVIQAEEKGTPLIEVLQIQATVLRMRRSVWAEEAAARAGVKMLLPLLMIFGCVFLLLIGPFVVNFMENGFG
jgi:tight adherence protein C